MIQKHPHNATKYYMFIMTKLFKDCGVVWLSDFFHSISRQQSFNNTANFQRKRNTACFMVKMNCSKSRTARQVEGHLAVWIVQMVKVTLEL